MNQLPDRPRWLPRLLLASLLAAGLAACSDGSVNSTSTTSSGGGTTSTPASTVNLSGVVADGLIQGATACYDLNDNGVCDPDEPTSSETDANGGYLLSVPLAEAGKHNVIVNVPATAIDMDSPGTPVGTAFVMRSPPQTDTTKPVFVSPITTVVTDMMAASGTKDPTDAITQVQTQLGMSISPLDNFIEKKTTGNSAEQAAAQRVATIAQVVTQLNKQITQQASAASVTTSDARTLISVVVLNNLSTVVNQVDNKGTATVADLAKSVLTSQNLSTSTIAAQAAAAKQVASATVETQSSTPTPFSNLRDFRYTDANNYFIRIMEGDDVADSDGYKYQHEIRQNIVGGVQVTDNGTNNSFWSASRGAWLECRHSGWRISRYKSQTTTADASSSYCGGAFQDTSRRTVRSIEGAKIADIVGEFRAYPFKDGTASYSNWGVTPTAISSALTFPAGSQMHYVVSVQVSTFDVINTSARLRRYPGAGVKFASWPFAATLDQVIATWAGNYAGSNFASGTLATGAGTLQAAEVDDATVTDSSLKTRKRYMVGLQKTSDTEGNARFFACGVKASDNTPTNCTKVLDTTYRITTQGDARVLRFVDYPTGLEAAMLGRFQINERAGSVFGGSSQIPSTSYSLRLNKEAWGALRSALGIAAHTPATAPVALDAASWLTDFRSGPSLATSNDANLRWIDATGTTGGTFNEVRLIFGANNAGTQTFARNAFYWSGTAWLSSDGTDNVCPSNGVNLGTWTSSPRSSVFCRFTTQDQSGFDIDISGKTALSVLNDMRLYGAFSGGNDYSSYGPNLDPSSPEYTSMSTAIFPKGSRLRHQVNTTTADADQFSTNSPLRIATNTPATSLGSITAVFTGGFSGTATDATTLQLYAYHTNDVPATGLADIVRWRVSFQPSSGTAGAARFFRCEVIYDNTLPNGGASTNCQQALETTYTIAAMGGKNMLKFAAMPTVFSSQVGADRSLVEHSNRVYTASANYVGSKNYQLRLNQPAYETILNVFGVSKPAQTAIAP